MQSQHLLAQQQHIKVCETHLNVRCAPTLDRLCNMFIISIATAVTVSCQVVYTQSRVELPKTCAMLSDVQIHIVRHTDTFIFSSSEQPLTAEMMMRSSSQPSSRRLSLQHHMCSAL